MPSHKPRLVIEMEALAKTFGARSDSLAKSFSSDEFKTSLQRYLDNMTAYMLNEYRTALQKGASTTDRDMLFKRAAETYLETASPLDGIRAEIDGIRTEIGTLAKSFERMRQAFPAFRRWALFGIKDPDGVDVAPPPRDPLEPIMSLGQFMIAEKKITFDDRGRPSGDHALTPFELPRLQQRRQVDPATAVAAFLAHNPRRGED